MQTIQSIAKTKQTMDTTGLLSEFCDLVIGRYCRLDENISRFRAQLPLPCVLNSDCFRQFGTIDKPYRNATREKGVSTPLTHLASYGTAFFH